MTLQICLEDSTAHRRLCLFQIRCTRMDEPTFFTMSEMLREHLEWPIRRNRADLRLDDVFRRLLLLFPNSVTVHPLNQEDRFILRDMEIPRLVISRIHNERLIQIRPYIEGTTRLHELFA
jgi:hypothetical protein